MPSPGYRYIIWILYIYKPFANNLSQLPFVFSNGNIVCLKFCFIQTVLFCTWKENLVQ